MKMTIKLSKSETQQLLANNYVIISRALYHYAVCFDELHNVKLFQEVNDFQYNVILFPLRDVIKHKEKINYEH